MSLFADVFVVIFMLCSAVLLIFGLHHYAMLFYFWRARKAITAEAETRDLQQPYPEDGALPEVLTQIPLYNEYNVAERIIRAVVAIDYPREKHVVQVLDDSTDDTIGLVDRVVAELREKGHRITAARREVRSGFKAGALDYGLQLCAAEYVAIFDSDFVPPRDFLRRTLPHLFENESCGLVQARWGSLNTEESALTKAQGLGIDGHFVVEQTARAYNGLFLNFNGTAGIWRREAIDDAGGWTAETLTEDLELSYRAQLRGWTFHYLPQLVAPAELPATYEAFRSQQFRWAKGSMQTAKLMLGRVWRAPVSLLKKVEATFHLGHYGVHFCMFIHALLGLPILLSGTRLSLLAETWYLTPLAFAVIAPSLLYLVSQIWLGPRYAWRFFRRLPMLLLVGFGICLSNARACLEGMIGVVSPFVRTPKQGKGQRKYRVKLSAVPIAELAMAVYTGLTAALYARDGQLATAAFFSIYACGFALFGGKSVLGAFAKVASDAEQTSEEGAELNAA